MDEPVSRDRGVRIWLGILLVMVVAMILIGGITRLTRSGLSMVDWRPVTGWLPPLEAREWETAFAAYRETPEFQKRNSHFELSDFKTIFFWEYMHRLWGRLIGLVTFFPGVFFLISRRRQTKAFDGRLARLWLFLLLGGAFQGALGWYMVQSGLVNIPRVSHYRLAAHLCTALLLQAYIFWQFLNRDPALTRSSVVAVGAEDEKPDGTRAGEARAGGVLLIAFSLLLFLQLVFGAFTAGLRAGFIHNTFPTMSGSFVPDGLWTLEPAYRNFLENLVTIQFTHRLIAYVLLPLVLLMALRPAWYPDDRTRAGIRVMAALACVQFGLGVATILAAVPVWLGVVHQTGAVFLFSACVFALHARQAAGRRANTSVI